jgi:acyl-CoA synthetase (NDP forming)
LAPPDVRNDLEKAGFTVFEDPNRAVRAAHALIRFSKTFDAPQRANLLLPPPSGARRGQKFTETESKKLLSAAGIPVTIETVVADADAAVAAAERIGFPVVLKIVSADIAHKSDIGGVVLNVPNPAAVRDGYEAILAQVKTAAPDAGLDGVLVAPMITGGVETVMGVFKDPLFGPVVMFGLGGVFVEVLGDVVFRPAPFDIDEARTMIAEVRGKAIFEGVRGAKASDVDAVADALSKLSLFAAANADTIASIDINPFLVLPTGEGAIAVDALIETLAEETDVEKSEAT